MGWLDSAIEWVSPRWGAQRAAWRTAGELHREYDASGRGRLNQGWRATNTSAQVADGMSRETMLARARDMERNSDVLAALLSAMDRNVVGAGVKLQARTGNEELNKQIERLWENWCRPINCDAHQGQSFSELMRMVVRREYVDGGVLLVKRYEKERLVPLCLQAIEVSEIDGARIAPKEKANRVIEGVEINARGQPQGIWVRQYDQNGYPSMESAYLAMVDIIWYWQKTRPSQVREITRLSSVLTRIRDADSLLEAMVVKERIAASMALFITEDPAGGVTGRGSPLKDGASGYDGMVFTPGMVKKLRPGEDAKMLTPTAQSGNATEFARLQQRLISAGQGLSYEAVARDLSQVTYSSARQGLIEDDAMFAIERKRLKEHVLDKVYGAFLDAAILAGVIGIPGYWEGRNQWTDHEFIPTGRKWIDPLKEVKADDLAVASGLTTLAQIAGEHGFDWRAVLEQRAEEMALWQQLLSKHGIENGGETG
ncbi:MAG: phage portal protein [Oscillospiraceae bacterium]|nr:phage portal protein [Oscillospiraceae bacterium]